MQTSTHKTSRTQDIPPEFSMTDYSKLIERSEACCIDDHTRLLSAAFLLEHIDADTFWKALYKNGLVKDQHAFMTAFATGVLQIASQSEFGPVRLPERPEEAA